MRRYTRLALQDSYFSFLVQLTLLKLQTISWFVNKPTCKYDLRLAGHVIDTTRDGLSCRPCRYFKEAHCGTYVNKYDYYVFESTCYKYALFHKPDSTLVVSKISIFCIWPSHPLKHLHVYYSATNQLSMTFAVIEVKTRCQSKNIGKPGQQCWCRRRMVVMMLKKLLSNNDPGLTYSESWFRADY